MKNALLHDAQMFKPTNICCHSYRFAANPAGQSPSSWTGSIQARRRAAEQRLQVGGRVLAQEENSPMVARPNQPIYPACVPPSKSHPPTSCELFVPVSGASPKTSGPASGTVSKGSLVQDQTSYLRKYQSAASTSSLPRYGTQQGWCRRLKLSNQEEGENETILRKRPQSERPDEARSDMRSL